MPALVSRRRSSRRRYGKPRRFVWSVVGPITYEETGSLTAGGLVSGADVFEAAEAGSLIADTELSGTSQAILQRSLLNRSPFPYVRRVRRRVLR